MLSGVVFWPLTVPAVGAGAPKESASLAIDGFVARRADGAIGGAR